MKIKSICCLAVVGVLLLVGCKKEVPLKVLQFNIWQEGTVVEGGFDGIVSNIIHTDADLITFSEVRNYKERAFIPHLVAELQKKGVKYYGEKSVSTGIISKYRIVKQEVIYPLNDDHGSVLKATVDVKGKMIVLYSAHLDYRDYAPYLPRGYSGSTWKKLDEPVLDVDSILRMNRASLRDEAVSAMLADARTEREQGRLVIIGGDFNEPSHLDWTEATKGLFDHRGVVIPWECSTSIYANGFVDAYRMVYPNPVSHPGFTFPADNKDIGIDKLTWTPEADERERIDFIYYIPDNQLKLHEAIVVGPSGSIINNVREEETSEDVFMLPQGTWPTDHKAVMATFTLSY